ncbi:MAG: FAD-dependent oxidoreductase, partial [Actinomycetota bacterium]
MSAGGDRRYDLLIVGGGPAGLAAAAEAAQSGLDVCLVDERPTFGGQIYKQPGPGFRVRRPAALGRDFLRGRALIDAAERSGATLLPRTSVVSVRGATAVLVEDGGGARTVEARRLLLAPGAYDRPVVFPGWTLPGVITAGGAQTLVKTQRVLPGKQIVFAGSGPLALAFPAQLRGYGANVTMVLEAGPPPGVRDVARLLRAARGNESLLRDAVAYRAQLARARVPLRYRRVIVRAEGDERVEAVVHARADSAWRPIAGTEERVASDTLCIGYGFFPSVELLRLAVCELGYDEDRGGPVAVRDAWMRTSCPDVFAAGDGTGVAGSYVAIDEGRLAALGVAQDLGAVRAVDAELRAAPIRTRLRRKEAFRAALQRMHAVGDGIYELATADTVVCRCEEVTQAVLDRAISSTADVNVVKGY